jgi:hypothetical protein
MIEARGRNGHFWARKAVIKKMEDDISIEIFSKREGRYPPIKFRGSPRQLAAMVADLMTAVRDIREGRSIREVAFE